MADNEHEGGSQPPSLGESGGRGPATAAAARDTTGSTAASWGTASGSAAGRGMAAVAGRLLSAHVTSCATERNWSFFGNIFRKIKNRLMLEHAQKIAFIRGNSKESMGADEEIMLSEIDMLD